MKVAWNTCDKELRVEIKSAYDNYLLLKFSLKFFKSYSLLKKLI